VISKKFIFIGLELLYYKAAHKRTLKEGSKSFVSTARLSRMVRDYNKNVYIIILNDLMAAGAEQAIFR